MIPMAEASTGTINNNVNRTTTTPTNTQVNAAQQAANNAAPTTQANQSGGVTAGAQANLQNDGTNGFVPCGNEADNPCTIHHLFKAFVVIVNYLITMAGFVAIAAIVYAGFLMVISQGQERLKEAKARLSGAIIGLVLVAAAFVLTNALFAGEFSVGVKNGEKILSSPLEYIRGY